MPRRASPAAPAPTPDPLAFLAGGGAMGALIRSMDWSGTSLGPVAGWPQSLRTTISICLASDLPICVIWGPGRVQLYNDAYRVICGDKHPRSMGQNFADCWKEAWPVIGQAHDDALAGDKAFLETQHIFLQRHGYLEECFFTFSFSPIRDEAGQVGGLFHPVIEMTAQMLAQRRTRALRDLSAQASKAKSVTEVLALSAQTLAEYALDLPFVLTYALDPQAGSANPARLAGAAGLDANTLAGLGTVSLMDAQAVWPLQDVVRSGEALRVGNLRQRIPLAGVGPHPEWLDAALLMPLTPPGAERPAAILVAGISPSLPMNEAYRSFYDLLASALTAAVVNASAHEDERRRARALAEIDRAKTAFFSNISHEFRTPLTLMLGPVEDALAAADGLPLLPREQLHVVHRNGLRLQRLVNSLLEFSRIEAGRVRAAYEPTDLAEFTTDLASNFRAACEKAGLALRVDCPPLGEPVFVDRPMWEKIVFNLLSNAFKFTFEGEIAVTLRQVGSTAELVVRDTGTGISADEMPRLFERFHRIENAQGRTHEGSGIGLALVQELVKLHGGTITAQSKAAGQSSGESVNEPGSNSVSGGGRGTTFRVSIPLGAGHLPPERVRGARSPAQASAGTSPFVQEALQWLPDTALSHDAAAGLPPAPDHALGSDFAPWPADVDADVKPPCVLVADDNADMRRYIQRLLNGHYQVRTVPDGEAALAAVRQRMPDLILTDVMMPRLDGVGLLRALRGDPDTAGVPVILLSARAGEESRVDGMAAGADAYLVKPFSAKELLANVSALLQITRLRQAADESIRASEERLRAFVNASSDVVYRMSADWAEMRHLRGREFIADTHEPSRSWLHKYIAPDDQPLVLDTIAAAIRSKSVFELEHRVLRVDGTPGWTFSRAIPLFDGHGDIVEWFGTASDVTARKQAEAALRQSEEKFRTLFESMDEGFCVIEMIFDTDASGDANAKARPVDYRFLEVNPAFEKQSGIHDAVGKRIREIAPDHEAHWFDIYGRVALSGQPIRFAGEASALDNRWFDVYAFRLGDAAGRKVAVLFNDITARKVSEEALRASENRSRAILESITDGFFALDADWRVTYINAAGERFLDRTPGDLTGKCLWDEFPDAVGSEFERVYRRVVASRMSESFTAHYASYDRWYETTAYPAPEGLTVYFRDVTDRRRVEYERQQFAALVEASSDFIGVAGLDQRAVYVNRAGMAMIGLEPAKLASTHVRDFFPASERDRILGYLTDSEGGKDVVLDTWFQHLQTGQLIPVSWAFLRLRDASGKLSGYATVTRDLSERRQHEESTQRTLAAIVERCPFGIYIVDDEFRIASMNEGSQQGAFANVRPVIGRPFDEAVRVLWPEPVAADVVRIFRDTLATGEPYHSRNFSHARLDLDQTEAYEFEVHRIDLPNGRHAAVCYYFDSTPLRQVEHELTEADRKKDEFLAILAHELRNPLAPIRNGLQLMKLAKNDGAVVEQARAMMERQVEHMVRLIDDLLDLSRISRGTLELKRERVELAVVLRNAVETSQPLIEQKGHVLSLVAPAVPVYLDGDAARLSQVVANLLSNSAKYTERGGHIRLRAEVLGGEIVLTVEDNGVGIPAHMLSRVFDMFTQVDRSMEMSKGGMGIGLSLVQRLVELHGGSVRAHSDGPGRGSALIVRLPVLLSTGGGRKDSARDEPPQSPPFSPAPSPARRRILVVDDNRDAADSLAELLTMMGNHTQTAYDGLEALTAAAAFRPDVTLLDIGMPRLNGYDACRRMRQQAWGEHMVLYALTGWGQDADQQRSQAAGFDAHLVKPVDMDELQALLSALPAARA